MNTQPTFNDMQTVKRHFFAMRNGVIADTLRRAGSPFRIIFGLNLPQLVDIASVTHHNPELAERLWANASTRESMLLAPMLYPVDEFDIGTARRWIVSIPSTEAADILCHRLLRHTSYAPELAKELCASENEMSRYTGLRLWFNLVAKMPSDALAAARAELKSPSRLTASVAAALADEAGFYSAEKYFC